MTIQRTHRGIGFIATAIYSECERYRYVLDYHFGVGTRTVAFVGLNPSTATEKKLDPTLTRCRNFAESWGYDGFTMLNLFAWRDTDPRKMKAKGGAAIGELNDKFIASVVASCEIAVCCWGNHGSFLNRSNAVNQLVEAHTGKLKCLKITKANEPIHPLYLAANSWLMPFEESTQSTREMSFAQE